MIHEADNEIHPTAVIDDSVVMGRGNRVGAFVVISGSVTLGNDNWIGSSVQIGAMPEIRSINHFSHGAEPGVPSVRIGDGNVIREGAQIHRGSEHDTVIGNQCFIMNQCYIAHDCILEDHVTMASSVLLAGKVRLGAYANLGMGTVVHQGRSIGAGTMVGMSSVVTRDVTPFSKSFGSPSRWHGINEVGMQRLGVLETEVASFSRLITAQLNDAEVRAIAEQVLSPSAFKIFFMN